MSQGDILTGIGVAGAGALAVAAAPVEILLAGAVLAWDAGALMGWW